MDDIRGRALAALAAVFGDAAEFREQQLEAIESVVDRRARTLVVQRTGWGKSVVYFIATRLLRDDDAGTTLIVSPLLALMRDQIAMAERLGIRAVTINSANAKDWDRIEQRLLDDEIDVLLISPERLNNPGFRERLLEPLSRRIGLLVIDEAHCISDWGHDFRPDYRRIVRLLELLPPNVPLLCTTATANNRVIGDIAAQLGDRLVTIRGPLDRPSLRLEVRQLDTQAQRLAWLATALPLMEGSGIVYCLTVADTEHVADWLVSRGISSTAYSGDTDPAARLEAEAALRDNEVKALVATSALGMGYDKPDLGFVVHYQSPNSPIAYYQQVGRAGRAVAHADAVLLIGAEDADIWEYFLRTSFPPQRDAELVVNLLQESGRPVPLAEIELSANIRRGRLTAMLKLLEVEGAVERAGSQWLRTLRPWTYDRERVDRVTRERVAEQEAMREYAVTTECRMKWIREALDDPSATQCGRCDRCTAARFAFDIDPALVAEAARFLRRRPVEFDPRKRWPGSPRAGAIDADRRAEVGRALSRLADGGWGQVVLDCKHAETAFPDDLVEALADLARGWSPEPAPVAIAYIPSLNPGRQLVPDLARRLAASLGLPTVDWVRKARATEPQKLMENSSQQLRNVLNAYTVDQKLAGEPVFLVDDVVDSRWTMTVVAYELRSAGSGPVFPLALARTKG
ncbi:MAG TPA: RecQ family ATP-dependent DNA helicase [Mycobacteriales bacterium]|nr:RecQ family ATP-dependent DNA helicase [Mycobacteriales bacterium]